MQRKNGRGNELTLLLGSPLGVPGESHQSRGCQLVMKYVITDQKTQIKYRMPHNCFVISSDDEKTAIYCTCFDFGPFTFKLS